MAVRPANPNGLGVVHFTCSDWIHATGAIHQDSFGPLLRHGYTIFHVQHAPLSQGTIEDFVAEAHRAVRFVRSHAAQYGIDPDRIGVTGAAAGASLALVVATRGGPGEPGASDPVDRASSAVQAVAVFSPLTDFLDLRGSSVDPGDEGPPKALRAAGEQEDRLRPVVRPAVAWGEMTAWSPPQGPSLSGWGVPRGRPGSFAASPGRVPVSSVRRVALVADSVRKADPKRIAERSRGEQAIAR